MKDKLKFVLDYFAWLRRKSFKVYFSSVIMVKLKKPKSWYQRWGVIALFAILGLILLNSFFGKSTNQKNLERDYEVLDFYCSSSSKDNLVYSRVEMKSFGNRNDQVWSGLIYLAGDCPNSEDYSITILEENQECVYIISGNIYRGYAGKEIINDTEIMNNLLYWDWESFVTGKMVDEVYKLYDIPVLGL